MTINLPFQFEFVLNLTHKCNLRCSMCTQYGEDYKENAQQELDISYWLKFLNEIKKFNPKPKLILMGGEPLLYKDFRKLFKVANKFNIETHIITNGYFLSEYSDILKNANTCITISIDGLNEVHDVIRCKEGLFKKILQNIILIDELQKSGSKIKLKINQVMLPENIENMVEFHKFFKKFNIEIFTFQHIQSSNENLNKLSQKQWKTRLNQDYCMGLIPKKEYTLDENYAENIIKALKNFKNYCHDENCFVFPALEDDEIINYYTNSKLDDIRKKLICATPWINPIINPNGDVLNCIGNCIGNIKDDSFLNIWNNKKAQNFRNNLLNNGKFTICTKCCNFYKGNFVAAPDGKLEINNIKMQLPGELNYVQSSKKIAFIKDNKVISKNGYIPVIPINIHTENMLNELEKKCEIIAISE